MIHIEIAAEKIFLFLGMPITNTLITSWVVAGLLIVVAFLLYRRVSMVPAPLQNVFEVLFEWLLGMMESTLGTRERAEKYFSIVATIFVFILVSNWLGIFPGIGSVGLLETHAVAESADVHGVPESTVFVPLFRSAASDLNFTLAIAIIAVFSVNILGIGAIGFWRHISKFISFRSPITFFVGILEFISEIAKMISFSFRLFGNIFAGEVLLVITGFLVPYFIPVPFLMLEVFVGFIQALVFAMLTLVFISLATTHH